MKRLFPLLVFCLIIGKANSQRVIGTIDWFGDHKMSADSLYARLILKPGDALPAGAVTVAQVMRTEGIPVYTLETVCCNETGLILFLGLFDRLPASSFRNAVYKDTAHLPDTLMQLSRAYQEALMSAVAKGDAEDDLSSGYSLLRNPAARSIQQQFIPLAKKYYVQLSKTLRSGAYATERAVAALVLPYSGQWKDVAELYNHALSDPDPGVRNNVLRAMNGIVPYARANRIPVSVNATRFAELLNSAQWTDRNKALFSLVTITENADTALLDTVRDRALPALVQMSAWKSRQHAFVAYLVLGRVLRVKDETIFSSWENNQLSVLMDKAAGFYR